MSRTLFIDCPFCEGMIEINPETGEIVNSWSAHDKNAPAGDKMTSALKKLEDAKKKRASLFDETRGALEKQKRQSEDIFKEQVEKVKKEGVKEKPLRPMDLD